MPGHRPHLTRYADLDRDSGVSAYAFGRDFILVEFRSHDLYRYDYRAPGRAAVQTMKRLAAAGRGLATFINRHVRDRYAEKLR